MRTPPVTAATAASASAIDFHGIPIQLGYDPFSADAFTNLFAGFERASGSAEPLTVELRAAVQPHLEAAPPGFLPTFCHGLVQGYSKDGAYILSDGQSYIEVLPKLGRMRGEIFRSDDTDVSSGMQHIALSLLLRERGIFDLHAATACTADRALVVLGDSGAGKTTLLLSLMQLGLQFLGDDRLLFREQRGELELLAYPRAFHLSPATLQLVPEPVGDLGPAPPDGKYAVEPLQVWPERFRRAWRGPVQLLLPHIEAQARSRVRRASAAEGFGKLLASSATVVVEAIERRAEQLAALTALANAAQAFNVTLGADLLAHPASTARRLLAEIHGLAGEA